MVEIQREDQENISDNASSPNKENLAQKTSELPKTILTFDHSKMFSYLYGKKWTFVPVVAITIYLYGVIVSKCIMTGKVLSQLFSEVTVLNTF